ncbi:MAG TPA: hypothetical protein VFZ89_18405 [Solirubrobacteraceae bacterium]
MTTMEMRVPAATRSVTVRWALVAAITPLIAGIALWALALGSIDLARADQHGLLGVLPPAWYLALAVLVGATAWVTCSARPSPWLLCGYIGAIVLVLYGTIPAVADVPQYPWTYKHIGVTALIADQGGIDAGADIYSRWPGFFAAAAAFSQLAGLPDPVTWAGWVEPLLMAVNALLVAAIAQTFVRSTRVGATAALVFVLITWVGQSYFAPQAGAMTMGLALLLVALRCQGRAAIAAVLALDAAIVVSHQLTPYGLLAVVGSLALFGFVRPRWIVALLALLPLSFLALNLGFVNQHFTLLTSLDPLNNLRNAGTYDVAPTAGKQLNAHAGQLLSLLAWGGALAGALLLRRAGQGRRAWALLLITFTPFVVLLGQDYGGEGTLRVILFSAPGCAILIACGIATLRRPRVRLAAVTGTTLTFAALFCGAFFGATQLNAITPGEVAASKAFYADAPKGSVLMLAGPGFPLRVGARYDQFAGPMGDADPNLLTGDRLRARPLGVADLPIVIGKMRKYSRSGFLAFSVTMERWAQTFGLTPPGALASLERAVAASPQFVLWRATETARIYRLLVDANVVH